MKRRAVRYAVMGYSDDPSAVGGLMTVSTLGLVKKANKDNPFEVVNEFVCNRLGSFLLLPIPTGEIVTLDGDTYFSSSRALGGPYPTADPGLLEFFPTENKNFPFLAAGAVVFDTWIMNRDRHVDNVVVDLENFEFSLIDHGHSILVGRERDALNRAETYAERFILDGDHCLLKYVSSQEDIIHWVEKVEQIPNFQIEEVFGLAVGLGFEKSFQQHNAIQWSEFLKDRRDSIREVFQKNWHRLPGIEQHSLFHQAPVEKSGEPVVLGLDKSSNGELT